MNEKVWVCIFGMSTKRTCNRLWILDTATIVWWCSAAASLIDLLVWPSLKPITPPLRVTYDDEAIIRWMPSTITVPTWAMSFLILCFVTKSRLSCKRRDLWLIFHNMSIVKDIFLLSDDIVDFFETWQRYLRSQAWSNRMKVCIIKTVQKLMNHVIKLAATACTCAKWSVVVYVVPNLVELPIICLHQTYHSVCRLLSQPSSSDSSAH